MIYCYLLKRCPIRHKILCFGTVFCCCQRLIRSLSFGNVPNSPVKLWFSIKVIATEFFQRHLIVGWLFNNILKLRQNRFGAIWEKFTIKIFNFHHRTPNFRKITNSDKTSDNCVLFFSRIFDRTSLTYFG